MEMHLLILRQQKYKEVASTNPLFFEYKIDSYNYQDNSGKKRSSIF